MDDQTGTSSPCPKCGGERIDTSQNNVGIDVEYGAKSVAIVCLSCRYVELYVKPKALEEIKRQGSAFALENSPEARARRAEWNEKIRQIEEKQSRKRRFFFF